MSVLSQIMFHLVLRKLNQRCLKSDAASSVTDASVTDAESDSEVSISNQDSFRCESTLLNRMLDHEESEPTSNKMSNTRGVRVIQQSGVTRTNCIDCLDRTNVAQFCLGLHALANQLVTLGITHQPYIEPNSDLVLILMRMYEALGDNISLQYGNLRSNLFIISSVSHIKYWICLGGSSAHKKSSQLLSNASKMTRSNDLMTYAKRYYSNSFTDHAKQDASKYMYLYSDGMKQRNHGIITFLCVVNLFLGLFTPSTASSILGMGTKTVHIWDLESDFYLHNSEFKRYVQFFYSLCVCTSLD